MLSIKVRYLRNIFLVHLLLTTITPALFSQEETEVEPQIEPEVEKKNSGFISIGINASYGNVDRSSTDFESELERKFKRQTVTFDGHYFQFTSRGKRVDENIELSLIDLVKLKYRFKLYGKITAFRNTYRGYDSQYRFGVGILETLKTKKTFSLTYRLGYQIRNSAVTNNLINDYNNGTNQFLQAGCKVDVNLFESVDFSAKFDYDLDPNNSTNSNIEIASKLIFKVNKWLDLEAKYSYFYAGLPVTGKLGLDQRFSVNLKINFN